MEAYQRSDPLAGAVLDGRYRVGAMIATGGMSTVYQGLDLRLDRPVALKVMDARYAADQHFMTRVQREARAVARLKDPAVVAVYDQGYDAGRPFLVMELVVGGTLRELLGERGPMPPHAAAAVLAPVLSGLAVAHRAGLVHRDVKPENVLISDDGEVKITDFGLVRAVAEATITSTSVILGTAAYLSPEQVATGNSDPRSDVYAVGILAYELLTGTTPFSGDTALAVAYQRMDHDVAPPSSAINGVPRQFDQMVLQACARDPAQRYEDAREMREALASIVAELELPDYRVPAPRNSASHSSSAMSALDAIRPEEASGADATDLIDRPTGQGSSARLQQTRSLIREHDRTTPEPSDRQNDHSDHPRQFAGIDLDEFHWAQQRARRALLFWLIAILTFTGMVAAAAWTLGSNLNVLL